MPASTSVPNGYSVESDHVAAVRRFNRFHTRLVGALSDRLLATDYSLPQVRVLYEIGHAPADAPTTAGGLARALGMDAGYLSRLIGSLEAAGLVSRVADAAHAKRLVLTPTAAGREFVDRLDDASAAEVALLLQRLSAPQQVQLVDALAQAEHLLGGQARPDEVVLRDPRPGDLGLVVSRQGALYAQEYGLDWQYEALVAQIVAQFVQQFVPRKERCWIADRQGQVVGSVFLVRLDDETAKLRLLYVEPSARGAGVGRRLVDACVAEARERGYCRMTLWTNDMLLAARHIYEAVGFVLVGEEAHHSFGQDLVGQTWTLAL